MEERLVGAWGEGESRRRGASECLISSPVEGVRFHIFSTGSGVLRKKGPGLSPEINMFYARDNRGEAVKWARGGLECRMQVLEPAGEYAGTSVA
jgi:hypothetical protein